MAETARRVRADLIVDAGSVTPERAAFADQVQALAGIPYILIDDSFARMPAVLRSTGAMLGVADRGGDLGLYAEHAIAALRGRLLIRPADTRPRVYFARGRDGLVTALPGSAAGEAIDEAGAINVAAPLGRGGDVAVTYAELASWDPEIIIAEQRGFYAGMRRNPAWRRLSAVRHDRVYLEPANPFGWIDDPAGVNRLIGLYWLSSLLYPNMLQEDLRTTTCDFYDKFYRVKLTNAQVEALVASAGAPKPELPRPIGGQLVGLGAVPPSSLSYGTQAGGIQAAGTQAGGTRAGPSATPAAPNAMPGDMTGTMSATMIEGGPSATCAVPGAPSPVPLPGTVPDPGLSSLGQSSLGAGPPTAAPGVPPPRPSAKQLNRAAEPHGLGASTSTRRGRNRR